MSFSVVNHFLFDKIQKKKYCLKYSFDRKTVRS